MSPAAPSAPRCRAARDDAAADAGADLDREEVLVLGEAGAVLAERHEVDVLRDQHGDR